MTAPADIKSELPADVTVSEPVFDKERIIRYKITSPFERKPVTLRIIEPKDFSKKKPVDKYKFLLVLPVEQQNSYRYGDGLKLAAETNLHNELNLILVAPEFCDTPWFCDHPAAKPKDESFLVKAIVPLLDKIYPAKRTSKLLLGFSKSGWGALSLILRNPDVFTAAVAWDSPLMETAPVRDGMKDAFGTQENFSKYQITALFKEKADIFRKNKRLGLFGFCTFRVHMEQAHKLLIDLDIPHDWDNSTVRAHKFGSGWEKEGILSLNKMSEDFNK